MTVVPAAQMISDFFFPSELHDTLPFAHFNSCLPLHLRKPEGAGEGREGGESRERGGHGTKAGGQGGGGAQEGVAVALYDAFIEHRRLAREAVRDSIDVYALPPCPAPSLPDAHRQPYQIRVFDMHLILSIRYACTHVCM